MSLIAIIGAGSWGTALGIIAGRAGQRVRLWSRNGRDWSLNLLAITAAVRALPYPRRLVGRVLGLPTRACLALRDS